MHSYSIVFAITTLLEVCLSMVLNNAPSTSTLASEADFQVGSDVSLRLVSYYISSVDIETPCYYNIYDKDQLLWLDISEEVNVLSHQFDKAREPLDRIRKQIEGESKKTLYNANQFGDTKRACKLQPNDITKQRFSADLAVATILATDNKSRSGGSKMLVSFPIEGYHYECLNGYINCDLKNEPFSTTFDS
ncbi:Piso0_000616 [Millerozyma farinosa CBS 7064]|uniref:Piso0_000616 protein n=1 Tax=Pichia sorbitophila (strain ATCC MYA-4447 / BCRC 22081 / CBS 7064 / NBRC 10061 / NRRL Y-12695) TaxID=559304 RepID=G8YPK7_PICSO|nr:Piso0_000616 [Millerozyma farinosa CBS 7064]